MLGKESEKKNLEKRDVWGQEVRERLSDLGIGSSGLK